MNYMSMLKLLYMVKSNALLTHGLSLQAYSLFNICSAARRDVITEETHNQLMRSCQCHLEASKSLLHALDAAIERCAKEERESNECAMQ